jgi:hypothetical protein
MVSKDRHVIDLYTPPGEKERLYPARCTPDA